MSEQKRLWDKGGSVDALIHRFTVGVDPVVDRQLVYWDCLGSAAHVRTLERAGLLTPAESAALLSGLADIAGLALLGRFDITPEQEDCHTAIENYLTQHCGSAGKKIHTGRSRNDQVATAMRLLMRNSALHWAEVLADFATALLRRVRLDGATRMPGYTHMQPAMPSSVGLWLHAHAEAACEQIHAVRHLLAQLDSCPLGTGAGFGVSLPLDRAFAAKLLGFTRAQRNPIDVQNSRGRLELYFARVAADIAAMLEKLACDLLLFTSREFGFFELPETMTTGSSIMPQKRNPDVLELMRGSAGRLRGLVYELDWLRGKLPSSYHRDLQLTKRPTLDAAQGAVELLQIATAVINAIAVKPERLASAMHPELFATDAAYALVRTGRPFREAYGEIGRQVREGRFVPEASIIAAAAGLPEDAALADLERDLSGTMRDVQRIRATVEAAEAELLKP